MPKADDPYYNRTRIPDEFVKDVGVTGLTPQEEFNNRERKFSVNGVDLRKFSNTKKDADDPYYGRRRLSKQEIHDVAPTGLSPEEEYNNRERKFSVNGVDLRKFSTTQKDSDDPYYGRKKVPTQFTVGIGETGNTPAADFETRERKQSVANFSGDPFAILAGSGHRASVVDPHVAGAAAAATRRRSSAVPPNSAVRNDSGTQHHSGYDGDGKLMPIVSKPELPPVGGVGEGSSANGNTNHYDAAIAGHDHPGATTTTTTTTTTATHHPVVHDHYDPDAVAPHEVR